MTGADIPPETASEYNNKLEVIRGFAALGECDRATQATDTLKAAVSAQADQNGERFTADLQELLDELRKQIEQECKPPEQASTDTSETTDTEPIITDTTTTETTTTETTTDTDTTAPPPNQPTPPGGGNSGGNTGGPSGGNPGGGPPNPGGGVAPGKRGGGR